MIPANTKAIGGRNIVGRSRRVLSVSSTGGDLDLLRSLPAPLDRRIEGLLGPLSTSNLLRSERTTKVARVWMSATPFVPLRFLKRRGANTLIGQVNAELVSREFTKRCLRAINSYHAPVRGQPANVVLNPTGGFKALVPYMVLIGMIKEVPCRYIFEQSTTLLELPPLPVEFSRSRFEAFKFLFERIERESAITLADWNATDRYLVSVDGWRLLVWRAIREDEVGAGYPQDIVVDPVRDRSRSAHFIHLEFTL